MTQTPLSPAQKVVAVFGGYDAVGEILGLSTVQIRRWDYPKAKGGHGGQVPSKHHPALLHAAAKRQKPLSLSDLLPWLEQGAA